MRFELGQKIIDKLRKPFIRVKWREVVKEIDMKFKLKEFIDVYNNLLCDDYSKETYLNALQYRLNSNFKLKSALQTPSNEMCESIKVKNGKEFELNNGWKFSEINLSPLGFDLKFYSDPASIYFVTEQYSYNIGGVDIDIKDKDIVIDGGACYGDTALWFAYKVGEKGKVYSFEFINENLNIFKESLSLNPELKDRIKILNNALYSNSESDLYVYESGPGTFCSMEKLDYNYGGGGTFHDKNKSY